MFIFDLTHLQAQNIFLHFPSSAFSHYFFSPIFLSLLSVVVGGISLKRLMLETNHHHQPPPTQAPQLLAQPLGAARGPTFPPAEQLTQLHYCIHSNPSWHQTVILGFQHYIVMLGTTVMISSILVPRMGGGPGEKAHVIQALSFMSGINTLLQTWFGTRLPTVMGPSFAYYLAVLSIINDLADEDFSSEHERFLHTMRAIQGALIASSFINIVLGYGRAWGNLTRLFSPLVVVPFVCLVGLGLFARGFPELANCVEIGLPMLILLVVGQQAFAAILTSAGAYNNVKQQTKLSCRTDRSGLLSSAPWIKIPYPFQWGTPIFRASHVFGMMGAALVSSVESTGAFIAASRFAGATAPPAHVLTRSIGLQGIGQLIEGIFGSLVGTSPSVENIGLLALTHVGSRRVLQISTAFMIFFSIFGKFGAFFASIPLVIFAAIYCVLYGLVAAVGITFIQFTNNNSMRNIYILGLSLFLVVSIPQYFHLNTDGLSGHGPVRTGGGWFNDILNTIFASPPTVAMIVGVILDNTLDPHHTRDDRGIPWWAPFQHKKGDSRNDEFYSYPLKISEYMPTRFL